MPRIAHKLRWFAIILPLLSIGLSGCVIAPYPGPAYYYGYHERGYWR
jgi:hypothetical protein